MEKLHSDFHKKKSSNDGLKPYCKMCSKLVNKNYYNKNRNEIISKNKIKYDKNTEHFLNKNRKWQIENKEYISKTKREYYAENKEVIKERSKSHNIDIENKKNYNKKYREEHTEYFKKYRNNYNSKRKKEDYLYKLTTNIRTLICMSFKKTKISKSKKCKSILGCDFKFFKSYIEEQFKEGMCWENYGQWHLDHKIPISWDTNEIEILKLNHYSNFQPLWKIENLSKGNRYMD